MSFLEGAEAVIHMGAIYRECRARALKLTLQRPFAKNPDG